jgi:hypothetical protein
MINDIVMKTVKTIALVILAAFSLAAFSGCKDKTMTNVQYVLRNNSSHMLEIIHPKIGDNTLMPGENFQFSFTYKESDWEKAVKKDGILSGSSTVVVDGKTKAQAVQVFSQNTGRDYIIEDGLSVGDTIIAEGAGLLKEGMEVGPSPTPSPSSPKWEKGNKKRPETKEN